MAPRWTKPVHAYIWVLSAGVEEVARLVERLNPTPEIRCSISTFDKISLFVYYQLNKIKRKEAGNGPHLLNIQNSFFVNSAS